jgi:hypothetical protein
VKPLLLVEGKDDEFVVLHLFKALGFPEGLYDCNGSLYEKTGIEPLLEALPRWIRLGDRDRIALIVDADEDVNARWTRIRQQLLSSGCTNVPPRPMKDGTFVDGPNGKRVGVWVMPDNRLPGMLEDFLAFLVPDGDALLPHVDDFLTRLPADHPRRFADRHHAKARIHAWLSVQKTPGRPLGQAITLRFLDAKRDAVDPFVAWLRRALA